MKVSIAMATYNGELYLREQLESFCQQTRLPDELVVSDDCSSDATLEILEQFAARAPFFVTLQRNSIRQGYAQNFSRALQLTSGDLVFLSDQDDVWHPHKIEHVLFEAFANPSKFLFVHDALVTDARLNPLGISCLGYIRYFRNEDNHLIKGCLMAVRRSLLDLALPVPYPVSHDRWLNEVACGLRKRMNINSTLMLYRRHDRNTSGSTSIARWRFRWVAKRASYLWGLYNLALSSKLRAPPDAKLQRQLLKWAQDTKRPVAANYRSILMAFKTELEKRAQQEETRERIQMRLFPSRIFAATGFWLRGGYKQFSGLKSYLRDILLGRG